MRVIGFDLVINRDFSCSGRFSGDSIRVDFATRGQSAPGPRIVRRCCSHHEQKVFFWSCYAALNAGQSGAAAEACLELFQQVRFVVFDLQTVGDSTVDSPPFFFLPTSELFLIVQFSGVEHRTVWPSTPDNPGPDPRTVRAPYGRQSGPVQIVLFSLVL